MNFVMVISFFSPQLYPDAICLLVMKMTRECSDLPAIDTFERKVEIDSRITILLKKSFQLQERSLHMFSAPKEFYRLDPLTGCSNFLSFVEALSELPAMVEKQPFAILNADLNHLYMLNKSKGRAYGDSVIRWMEIVLREESNAPTYRIGGDQFSVILTSGSTSDYEEVSDRIFARLNREGEQQGLPAPAVRIAVVHYNDHYPYSLNDMMFQLGQTMLDVKSARDRMMHAYHARDLIKSDIHTGDMDPREQSPAEVVLRWIANDAIGHLFFMGKMLDTAQRTSYVDAISGLPNMRAVLLKLEKEIASRQPFTVLLMDGDNTRAYNNVSYACGDDMIQKISAVLSEKLRPGDFLARWRSGDEFMVILPNTSSEAGRIVGERFRLSVKEASLNWMFPITITTGVATYPQHGSDVDSMVDAAEKAMKKGKDEGKDQVVLADWPGLK
jgi:diguanylate cyclase (GGDEF)-like protein